MTPKEIIAEIFKLPLVEQRQVLDALLKKSAKLTSEADQPISEEEFEQMLFAKGIISEIPSAPVTSKKILSQSK